MKKIFFSAMALLISPSLALAQPDIKQGNIGGGASAYGDIIRIIQNVGSWMLGILLTLSAIFIIYAAFLFLTAAGDETKVKEAKNIIIYAIVAIVVGILAWGITQVVQSIILHGGTVGGV